jgi:beta-lactam-binding protein with PASTA domain
MEQGRACDLIRKRGFTCKVEDFSSTTAPQGTVVDQLPGSQEADAGTTVTIYVSTYVPPVATPTPTPTPPVTPAPGTTTNGGIVLPFH